MTLAEIIRANKIAMTAERADSNPNMTDAEDMDHWRCTFTAAGRNDSFTVLFSMGRGHDGKAPEAVDVLDCIALDASGAQLSFEDWCADYGYDSDSRKAEKLFNVVTAQTTRAGNFFGYDLLRKMISAERL